MCYMIYNGILFKIFNIFWIIVTFAGMYVLAKQADSNITPEQFWKYALETSNECRNNDSGSYVGRIINPQGLINKIQEQKDISQ